MKMLVYYCLVVRSHKISKARLCLKVSNLTAVLTAMKNIALNKYICISNRFPHSYYVISPAIKDDIRQRFIDMFLRLCN